MTDLSHRPPAGEADDRLRFPMPRPSSCPFGLPAEYERLRTEEPVARARLADGRQVWLVTRYDDVRTTLTHPGVSADLRTPGCPVPGGLPPLPAGIPVPYFRTDPPEHTTYRKLLLPRFTVRQVRNLRPRIQEIVDRTLDDMGEIGPPTDLVRTLALPVPSLVICDLLGVPYADHEFFQERAEIPLRRTSTPHEVLTAMGELRGYLGELLESKRRDPGEDILSTLAAVDSEGGQADRIVATAQALLNAGHETTANMISLSTLLLLDRPELVAELREDAARWPHAVEELLRYFSIGDLAAARAAVEDVEIGGQRIRAGDGIYALVGAANRDRDAFTDPEEFDIGRADQPHVAFGFGVHQCIGQNLARVELEIVLESLFRRFPKLRLDTDPAGLSFKNDSVVYGLHALPVAW
ncbi:Cytochrome P450 [Actinomadura meyerae]|uniref:Cytochrome P450 n=1 Tax=Actinomadura meyerae TaxID=240840 RepID=A0A239NH02_9ACTN|nr:cytochrome P450 [Actinomadura meyerae]SNT53753.1 Cytochrome P450 [Actinomadura meyerae]